jgi:alkaline phosphatase D
MRARQLSRREFLALAATAAAACGGSETNPSEASASSTSSGAGASGAGGQGGTQPGTGGQGGAGTGGAGGEVFSGPGPEPTDAWDAPGLVDDANFDWGVQTGDATTTTVLVSAHTLASEVTLTVMRGVDSGWQEVSSGQSFVPQDGMVHLELSALAPDTTYAVAFYDLGGINRSRVARFRTAIPSGHSRVLRFGATSCLGDARDPWPSLSHSLPEKFDFFMLVGDTIYGDNNPDAYDYKTKYRHALSLSGLQDLTAGTSVIATWDDHEVDNNWSWSDNGIQQKYDDAIAAFRQHIPQRQGPAGTGIWRKLSWGDTADVLVLDCRAERGGGNYISLEQMVWLKQELDNSTATFKFIVNSVPVFDFSGTVIGSISQNDRWQGYPQRAEILSHIRDQQISGVLWISGDVHFGAIGQVDQDGNPGDHLWDVIVGPAGSIINPSSFALGGDRLPVVVSNWNWVSFEADPATGTVAVRFIGDNGQVLDQMDLKIA